MPNPQYRGRSATAAVGDVVAGWADSEGTIEVQGTVVSVLPDHPSGDNLTLAVLEYDLYPEGTEPPHLDVPDSYGAVVAKDHEGRAYALNVRLQTCCSERLELLHRRTGLAGWLGAMRTPNADVLRARHGEQQTVRKGETPAGAPRGGPIANRPPEPLPPPPPAEGMPPSSATSPPKPVKKG